MGKKQRSRRFLCGIVIACDKLTIAWMGNPNYPSQVKYALCQVGFLMLFFGNNIINTFSSILTEEDKNRRWGLTSLTGPCPWTKRKSSPSLVWNPWWNKGPIWIGQSIGKILREYLKDRGFFTLNNLSTTFRIPKGRVLQGNNLGYKERRQDLTTIKAPIPPHIKVHIIDPSLAL